MEVVRVWCPAYHLLGVEQTAAARGPKQPQPEAKPHERGITSVALFVLQRARFLQEEHVHLCLSPLFGPPMISVSLGTCELEIHISVTEQERGIGAEIGN